MRLVAHRLDYNREGNRPKPVWRRFSRFLSVLMVEQLRHVRLNCYRKAKMSFDSIFWYHKPLREILKTVFVVFKTMSKFNSRGERNLNVFWSKRMQHMRTCLPSSRWKRLVLPLSTTSRYARPLTQPNASSQAHPTYHLRLNSKLSTLRNRA